jgi:hypothetical protein
MKLQSTGTVAGLSAAVPLAYVLRFLLYGVSPLDPWTFVAVPAILSAIALAAMSVPVLRAVRVEPTTALRHE